MISAEDLNTDSFLVDKISLIPGAFAAIIIASDFGAFFFDLEQ